MTSDNATEPSETEEMKIQSEATETKEQVTKEAEKPDFEEKYFRCLAEMENMRKRLLKEQKDVAKISLERFIRTVLEPIDNLENALTLSLSASSEVRNWLVGFDMIKQQFVDCLSSQGITSYEAQAGFFDPNLHEAVETICDNSVPKGTIIKQFTKGYKMASKVIRPAKVAVSSSQDITSDNPQESSSTFNKSADETKIVGEQHDKEKQ